MASITVYSWEKKESGKVDLPEEIFGQALRKDVLHAVVRWQLACRRQGTHSTKTKGLVSGGGKKPFKQKGTGSARQGSSRSPLMPGGGTAFGPQPRDYSYTLPKKVRKAGLKIALSYLVANKKLWIVNELDSADGKTSELNARLKKFGVNKAILVDVKENDLVKRASRNLKSFRYLSAGGLNVYDMLRYDGAILTKASVDQIIERLGEG